MDQEKLIKSIQSAFKLSGLRIKRKCCLLLSRQLRNLDEEDQDNLIPKIAEHVLLQDLTEPCVSVENLKVALTECLRPMNSFQETETVFNVLDAFRIPKIRYDVEKKKFVIEQMNTPDLFSQPVNKSLIFKERLELLWHRTLKHEVFAPVKFGEIDTGRLQLKHIEHLLSSSKIDDVYVMGFLAQLTEGQYYLEDASGAVRVDLRQATYGAGLITEGSIVLVNGDYDDRMLTVRNIALPPAESSAQTRSHFGSANTFGGSHPVCLKNSEKLKTYEVNNPAEMIIFISELWLDNQIVLHKFKQMLEEFSNLPPAAFVLCGNFLSFPPNVTSSQELKEGFKRLSDIVVSCPDILKSSKFVLIPGPYDPGAPKILPRAPLPNYVVNDFLKEIPGTILATNPCRIQYCTKEIIVMREDILTKCCRNTLYFPRDGEVHKHYAKSIISQSHLAPMNLQTVPVYWKHDQALQLYPTPDLIVLADRYEPFKTEYNHCQVINPGIFSRNDFPFKVYYPSDNKTDDSAMEKEQNDSSFDLSS